MLIPHGMSILSIFGREVVWQPPGPTAHTRRRSSDAEPFLCPTQGDVRNPGRLRSGGDFLAGDGSVAQFLNQEGARVLEHPALGVIADLRGNQLLSREVGRAF